MCIFHEIAKRNKTQQPSHANLSDIGHYGLCADVPCGFGSFQSMEGTRSSLKNLFGQGTYMAPAAAAAEAAAIDDRF